MGKSDRERKGAFYTPRIWVELSQKYIADVLGANWQDEYYVWDCAAGTGNLLAGLTNKYNVWAYRFSFRSLTIASCIDIGTFLYSANSIENVPCPCVMLRNVVE
jgi:hypothetical protein